MLDTSATCKWPQTGTTTTSVKSFKMEDDPPLSEINGTGFRVPDLGFGGLGSGVQSSKFQVPSSKFRNSTKNEKFQIVVHSCWSTQTNISNGICRLVGLYVKLVAVKVWSTNATHKAVWAELVYLYEVNFWCLLISSAHIFLIFISARSCCYSHWWFLTSKTRSQAVFQNVVQIKRLCSKRDLILERSRLWRIMDQHNQIVRKTTGSSRFSGVLLSNSDLDVFIRCVYYSRFTSGGKFDSLLSLSDVLISR